LLVASGSGVSSSENADYEKVSQIAASGSGVAGPLSNFLLLLLDSLILLASNYMISMCVQLHATIVTNCLSFFFLCSSTLTCA
jgi:hypothetical protein